MHPAAPKVRALEIAAPAPAPTIHLGIPASPARLDDESRFPGRLVGVGSALVSAALLVLLFHPRTKPAQPAPIQQTRTQTANEDSRVADVPAVPAQRAPAGAKPFRKMERPSRVVDTSPLEPPPAIDAPQPVASAIRLPAPALAEPNPAPVSPRMQEGFESSRVLRKVKPIYPEAAASAQVQGTVRLKAIIDKQGAVQSVELESGPAMLFQAAGDAVRQWRFLPARLNGVPVDDMIHINVGFALVK
jgi:TonB family protein